VLARAGASFQGTDQCGELAQAIARHVAVVGAAPDAAALAAVMAQRARAGEVAGVGTLLAAVGGAALKPHTASLRLRQTLNELFRIQQVDQLAPLGALGETLAAALQDTARAEELGGGARAACEVPLYARAHAAAVETAAAAKVPDLDQVKLSRRGLPPLTHVLIDLHARRTDELLGVARAASERLIGLLQALAAPQLAAAFRSQALLGAAAALLPLEPLCAMLGTDGIELRHLARRALIARGCRLQEE